MYDQAPETSDNLRTRARDNPTNERIAALVEELSNEAHKRVRRRAVIDKRWIEDLEQYHGQYDSETLTKLKKDKGRSTVFVNKTRAKTEALVARIYDTLFPTDGRHWDIGPTPVPEMAREEEKINRAMEAAVKHEREAEADLEDAEMREDMRQEHASEEFSDKALAVENAKAERSDIQNALDALEELRRAARDQSRLMRDEMDDHLKACSYAAVCRDVIEDAAKLGIGIMKGPVLSPRVHRRWARSGDVFEQEQISDLRPAFERVDPWSFYWDPDVRKVEDGEGNFERHLMNRKQLRKLSRRPDMDKSAIRALLEEEPKENAPSAWAQLYSITDDESHQVKGKYQVWEYTGPLDAKKLMALALDYSDMEMAGVAQEVDPLDEVHVRIWFCQNEILSFALHPMDSCECLYSVFVLVPSETSVAGYGMPRMVRDPQRVINAAWRLQMDNARISAGPQVLTNKSKVSPANGTNDYTLEPFKMWDVKDTSSGKNPFDVVHIDFNQSLIANIIAMATEDMDEVSGQPLIAQGEQGTGVTQTAHGMAILINQANVHLRRYIRNFDDEITVPNMRRLYDFLMQFSDKEEIKGDYEVDARGSSSLVREMQGPNLMAIANIIGENPRYDGRIDDETMLREIFKAFMIPTDGLLLSNREYEAEMKRRAENAPEDPMVGLKREELDLKRATLDAEVRKTEMETSTRRYLADRSYEAAMQKISAHLNIKDEELELKAVISEQEREQKDRNAAIEVAALKETGKGGGGLV